MKTEKQEVEKKPEKDSYEYSVHGVKNQQEAQGETEGIKHKATREVYQTKDVKQTEMSKIHGAL